MRRLALVLAVFGLTLSGCTVYDGGYAYPGYSVRYYERYPSTNIYYYDDRSYQRWHGEPYQEYRQPYHVPRYDNRYPRQEGKPHDQQWHGYAPPRNGWDQRYRRAPSAAQPQGSQRRDGYSRWQERERGRDTDGRRYWQQGGTRSNY